MRFLADESCDYRVVKALRDAGHDVVSVLERRRGAPDDAIFAWSQREQRILIAEDKDFGQLATASGLGHHQGFLLIRCPEQSRPELPAAIAALVARHEGDLLGSVVVWTPSRTRFRSAQPGQRGRSG